MGEGEGMSELGDIKARAEAYPCHCGPGNLTLGLHWRWCPQAFKKADLDRAIAIAEDQKRYTDRIVDDLKRVADDLQEERDQARADVLMLREALRIYWPDPARSPVLVDTEHYERYRKEVK